MNPYLPIFISAIVALGFVASTLVGTHLLGPSRKSKVKDDNFECGIDAEGDARHPISIKYVLVAILFVLFDVEVVFFYPYAVNVRQMGIEGFFAILIFVSFFLAGFYYVVKKGVLDWNKI